MKPTLLSEALKINPRKPGKLLPNEDEMIELSLAWINDKVSLVQASKAVSARIGRPHGMAIYVDLARALRAAYRKGLLKSAYPSKKATKLPTAPIK